MDGRELVQEMVTDIEHLREALAVHASQRTHAELLQLAIAASELLALKENGQTVEWCESHQAPFGKEGHFPTCLAARYYQAAFQRDLGDPCRMVKASLHIHREGT
jgi:hypothetical protein